MNRAKTGVSALKAKTGSLLPEVSTPRPTTTSAGSTASLSQEQYQETFQDMLSQMDPRYVMPPTSKADAAFQGSTDFSRQNQGIHNDFKINTFQTSEPVFRKGTTFKKQGTSPSEKKWAPMEGISMQDLLWICDQTFMKTAQNLSAHLTDSLDAQMTKAVAYLQRDVTDPIIESCARMNNSIVELPTTLDPAVQRSVAESVSADLAQQQAMLRRLLEDLAMGLGEVKAGQRQSQQELREGQNVLALQLREQLDSLTERMMHTEQLVLDTSTSIRVSVDDLSKECGERHEMMKAEVDKQLQQHLHDHQDKVEHAMKELQAEGANEATLKGVLSGVEEIQHDLKEELSATAAMRERLEGLHSKRSFDECREEGIMTDPPNVAEAWIQTGDDLEKQGKGKKKKLLNASLFKARVRRALRSENPLTMFASEHLMKKNLKDAMMAKTNNVQDRYNEEGCAQMLARSRKFENFTFLVIFLNAIWIAVDLDSNPAVVITQAELPFIIAENLFCCYFLFDVLVRFLAYRKKRDVLSDWWLVFDSMLVFIMAVETWFFPLIMAFSSTSLAGIGDAAVLRVLRMVKMLRLSRMAKLLQAAPELVIVVKAIGAAARSIAVIGLFSVVVVYIFAIFIRQVTSCESGAGDLPSACQNLNTVAETMYSLVFKSLFSSSSGLANDLMSFHPLLFFVAMAFVVLTSVTLTYMLIGVMVNVIQMVASTERDAVQVSFLVSNLRDVLQEQNMDIENAFSKTDFKDFLTNTEVSDILQGVDVDCSIVLDTLDLLWDDFHAREGRPMHFADVVDIILKMRGTNTATVRDVKEAIRAIKAMVKEELETATKTMAKEMRQDEDDDEEPF